MPICGMLYALHRLQPSVGGCNEHGQFHSQVENLVKRYGDVEAVRGVSFSVEEGEVFGLLGPNGAGKTSTVEILEGLRTPGRRARCPSAASTRNAIRWLSSTKSALLCNPLPCRTNSA